MFRRDLAGWLGFVLAVLVGMQLVKYWVQVDSVQKTVDTLIATYHLEGAESYREQLEDELYELGLDVGAGDILTVEDRRHDEFRVEVRYTWPLKLLWMRFERAHVARTATVAFGV